MNLSRWVHLGGFEPAPTGHETGSWLDTILHFCYNKTLIRIKNDQF